MASYTYTPRGTCSRKIDFTLENGIVKEVRFTGGCSGNTQGVAALCVGRPAEEVVKVIKGDPLRDEAHLLPRPAGKRAGNRRLRRREKRVNKKKTAVLGGQPFFRI